MKVTKKYSFRNVPCNKGLLKDLLSRSSSAAMVGRLYKTRRRVQHLEVNQEDGREEGQQICHDKMGPLHFHPDENLSRLHFFGFFFSVDPFCMPGTNTRMLLA
jgi:hypothetical protein